MKASNANLKVIFLVEKNLFVTDKYHYRKPHEYIGIMIIK